MLLVLKGLSPNYPRRRIKYAFTLRCGPGHDLGTISETIKKPASEQFDFLLENKIFKWTF